jgi:hypothetical protein
VGQEIHEARTKGVAWRWELGVTSRKSRAVPAFSWPATQSLVRRLLPAMTHDPHLRLAVGTICLILAAASSAAGAWKEKVLYSFQGGSSDGYYPAGGVVFDQQGNLYGADSWGGSGCSYHGCGTLFEVSPPTQKGGSWTDTAIYAFQGVTGSVKDGLTPEGGLIIDQDGNLYGTTTLGGNGPCILLGSPVGCGIVYELSPPAQKGGAWTETILYNFQGGNDGYFPIGDLVFDKHGNLYGATWYGGGRGTNCDTYYGGNCGTVFKLSPSKQKGGTWTEEILHSFAGVDNGQQVGDGADPNGALILDSKGAVYGTTYFGGNNQAGKCEGSSGATGCGTVFKLSPPTKKGGAWTEKLVYLFKGIPDGAAPSAGVILGAGGDLYGADVNGGTYGQGVIFRVKPPSGKSHTWRETVLYTFEGRADGERPTAPLIAHPRGGALFYGTSFGGDSRGGVFFRLGNRGDSWSFTALYSFTGSPNASGPGANLIFDRLGNLYSTTQYGGTGTACQGGCGTVFEVRP